MTAPEYSLEQGIAVVSYLTGKGIVERFTYGSIQLAVCRRLELPRHGIISLPTGPQ
jgi:hypothetical protein